MFLRSCSSWLAILAIWWLVPWTLHAEPAVYSVSPSEVERGSRSTLLLSGVELGLASSVVFTDWRIEVLNLSVSSDLITAEIAVSQRAVAGPRDLTITFSEGSDLVLEQAFSVVPGPSVLLWIWPDELVRGAAQPMQLQGLNLDAVQSLEAGDGVEVEGYIADEHDPTRASVTLTATDLAELGPRAITVHGFSGLSDTLTDALVVVPGELLATSLTPSAVVRGQTAILTATGSNLDVVQSVQLGYGIRVQAVYPVDPTTLQVSVVVQEEALPVGVARDVTLVGGGQEYTLTQGLVVNAGPLTLSSLRPDQVTQGTEAVLTLGGTNLDGLTSFSAGEGISVVQLDPLSPVRAVVDVDISAEATPGYRSVSVVGSFGQQTVPDALRVLSRQELPCRINYPDLVDFGFVEVGARKRVSLIFFNESAVEEEVTLDIATGDIRDFRLHDADGDTLESLSPSTLTFTLEPLGEAVVVAEFRPSLQVYSEVSVQVTARDQHIGGITLRGRGLESVLGFYPPPPITIPSTVEGAVGEEQVSTLSESSEPTRIEGVQLVVERDNTLFAQAQELTEIILSEPIPPSEDLLFGVTLVAIQIAYPAGTYEGEIWFLTDRATAPIVPLSFFALVIPAVEDGPIDEPADPAESDADMGADLPPDAADLPAEPEADTPAEESPDQPEAALDPIETPSPEGCCAQAAVSPRHTPWFWILAGFLSLWVAARRCGSRRNGARHIR